jgi:hypothetical protein
VPPPLSRPTPVLIWACASYPFLVAVKLVDGSAVPVRRPRGELAVVVAHWALEYDDGVPKDEVPAWLFRDDELDEAKTLEAGELMAAAAVLLDCLADHERRTGGKNVGAIRAYADHMQAEAEQWYERRLYGCRPRPRPRRSHCPPPRRRGSRQRKTRAPPGDEPDDDPDDVDRARRGWSR